MSRRRRLQVAQPHGVLVPRFAASSSAAREAEPAVADVSAPGERATESAASWGEGAEPLASGVGLTGAGLATEPEDLLQVGELAKAVGKTVRAIHLYEDLGLIHAHERSEKGRYRLFAPDSLQRLRWISKLQHLGLSLSQIQELVRDYEGTDSARLGASKLRDLYLDKLAETQERIAALRSLEVELQASLAYLSTCHSACEPDLSIRSCTECERHANRAAPELVAGLHIS